MPREGSDPVSVLMVAIGGYGFHYLKNLLEDQNPGLCRLAGVVDPWARQSLLWPVVHHLGVPVCATVEEFYEGGNEADLAVVSSPIHCHVPQSLAALDHGSAVLCDKPLGATIQECRQLLDAGNRAGRWVMVGYQWSFSQAIQALKSDIRAGLFGRPLRATALCCWPRDLNYYRRNDWAGRLRHADSGRWVLDGPANNAMAHFLHNLLYLLGSEPHLSARPGTVQAEMYRAYPIEASDTAACRVATECGTEVIFLASHATERTLEPRFRIELENATVCCGEVGGEILAVDRNGARKSYGAPDETPQFTKLAQAIERVRTDAPILCGPEAALAQTLCVNGMHDSVPDIPEFPRALVRPAPDPDRIYVAGLDDLLLQCYRTGLLPGEAGAPWGIAGRIIELAGYRRFPGGEVA
jgi:predicted dehydrogenase